MGDILQFTPPPKDEPIIEHVDSSTIVERLVMTPELKAEFEAAGYTIDEEIS